MITNEMVEAACEAWQKVYGREFPNSRPGIRRPMRLALSAALSLMERQTVEIDLLAEATKIGLEAEGRYRGSGLVRSIAYAAAKAGLEAGIKIGRAARPTQGEGE